MRSALAFATILTACSSPRPKLALTTTAEASQYVRTGRYDEAVRLCRDFARVHDGVTCERIGLSGEGRDIVALAIAKRKNLPVIYLQAGIHAGEIEGKDAGFWFLRDLLDGKILPGALDKVSVVFVPVMNPDGHERFRANNRPNQRGPEEMGWRTNATRLNLNRDFVKADAPETQAVLSLIDDYKPVLLVDLHCTDGAKFEQDLSVTVTPVAPRGDQLDETAGALSKALMARLTQLGHLPVWFYPSFVDDEDPMSGFAVGEAPPRFTHFYMAARSRLAVLVEAHSWRTYRERAQSTYHTLQAIFENAVTHAETWREVERAADAADARLAGTAVTLGWTNGPGKHELDFRGYAFEKRTSDLTGGSWLVYDETRPQIWKVPIYDELVPKVTIKAPARGYVIDGGYAASLAPLLVAHGLRWEYLEAGKPERVEVFRATKVTFAPTTYEGRTRATIEGAWQPETRAFTEGAVFVPIAQPGARLVMHLFEPSLPDSLVTWGAFNTAFERKEYIEPYVIEEEARKMLAADPALRAQFDAAVAADPELANSVDAKRDWFYRRHPSWDDRVDLVPVYRR
ncbi:MAG: peptidase M14 [Myxococcales bacterium]|nr:peptidase M14 [Myxococcales bacterium]